MGKIFKILISFAVAIACIFAMTSVVFAAPSSVNIKKRGSIYISANDPYTNNPLDGGSFAIHKVASLTQTGDGYAFLPTGEFALGGFELSDFSSPSLVLDVSDYIFSNDISPMDVVKLKRGYAKFPNLACGLYIIEQFDVIPGYYPINSFLVSIPMLIGNEYVYDINATPKIEQFEPENPNHRPPGGNFDTDHPGDEPPDDFPYDNPDNPSDNIKPGDDFHYDDETPPDVELINPVEANTVDFEKADIALKLFSADYSPAMKISLVVLGIVAVILILILIFDKKSKEDKTTE